MDVIEFQILYTLQELRTPLVDGLMVFITSLGDHGWFWILMGVLLFSFPRTRILGGCMLISIAAGFLLGNVMLKNIAARQRPCWLDPSVDVLAGIVMGTVIAWSVVRTAKRRMKKTDRMSGKP